MITGNCDPLIKMLLGSFTYIIPAYQRNYDWKQENCERLYNDLLALIKSNRYGHFFGSIVSVEAPGGAYRERLIIDGQQRLTTVSLLLLAMYTLLKSGELGALDSALEGDIRRCLTDSFDDKNLKLKLKPIKYDLAVYEELFKSPEDAPLDSHLTINFNYFLTRLRLKEVPARQLFQAISKLIVIDVGLQQEDDPQLVFESLNSTGVALTEGDKIRNFVLMGLSPDVQEDFYERYWNRVEKCTDYDVSAFVRDWLSLKTSMIPSQSKVYIAFKDYKEKNNPEIEHLLVDLLDYAELYELLLGKKTGVRELDSCIRRLNWLETTVTRPFFLEVLKLRKSGVLDWKSVAEIFQVTEAYLFRRMVCEVPTNALNKIFLTLHRDILRYDGTSDRYLDKFKYTMAAKKDRAVFPNDDEFRRKISERDVYKMNSKNRTYILERFECFGTIEAMDVYERLEEEDENERLSIEHIMPQHLTPAWAADLGDGYEEIHEKWLHRLANLTLSASVYNSKYGNCRFSEKLTMENGFKASGVRLNKWISEQSKWGEEELETRDRNLCDQALEIWPMPKSDYKPAVKKLDEITLADDADLSGRTIAAYSLRGMESQPVTRWIDMYVQVIRIMHSEDKSVIAKLALVNDPAKVEMSQYFAHEPNELRDACEIEPGLYAERNISTNTKMTILRKLFAAYHVDPDELVFSLREETEKDEASLPPRRQLRKRYWAYALDVIRAANADSGVFSKASPSTDNWVDGFFGVPGAHLCAKANYDNAQVLIYMVGPRAKAMYDFLAERKDKIEAEIGCPLNWNRGNSLKHSRVWIVDESIGLDNESNWRQMAEFHAKWVKKLYEVIVPLLRKWNPKDEA